MIHSIATQKLPETISTPLGELRLSEVGDHYIFVPLPELESLFQRLAGISGIQKVDILTPHWENTLRGGSVEKAPYMEPRAEDGKTVYQSYETIPQGYTAISDPCGKDGTIFIAPQGEFDPVPEDLGDTLREILNDTEFGFGSQIGPIKPVAFEWPTEEGKILGDPEAGTSLVVLGRLRFLNGQWIPLSGCPYGSNCGQGGDD